MADEKPGFAFTLDHITAKDIDALLAAGLQTPKELLETAQTAIAKATSNSRLRKMSMELAAVAITSSPDISVLSFSALVTGIYLGYALALNYPQPKAEDKPPIQLSSSSVFKPEYDVSTVN